MQTTAKHQVKYIYKIQFTYQSHTIHTFNVVEYMQRFFIITYGNVRTSYCFK